MIILRCDQKMVDFCGSMGLQMLSQRRTNSGQPVFPHCLADVNDGFRETIRCHFMELQYALSPKYQDADLFDNSALSALVLLSWEDYRS